MSDAPTGLYGWIRSNDGQSTGLFIGFLVAIQAIAATVLFLPLAIVDPDHAPFLGSLGYLVRYVPLVAAASIVWFGWQLFWHIETVKRAVGFRFIDDAEEPRLCRVIEPLITMMGLPIPFVGVIDEPARNAFACGIGRKKAVVVVTRGLIDDLDDEELGCVLAHELSHIKNGDIRLMAAANIFMSALTRMQKNNPLRFTPIHIVLAIAIPAVLPLTLAGSFVSHLAMRIGQVSRLAIASAREFVADAEAVQLTKNPAAMAAALVKVENRYRVESARSEDDAMMIAGDTEGEDATHPTVAQRIAALARTTGSMVFNAPGAIPAQVWDSSKTLSEARSAALLRQLPAAHMLPRIKAGSQENMIGLTPAGMLMAAMTVVCLITLHWSEMDNPRAIAAKFDVRPISLMLGMSQGTGKESAYADFEGQKNTLAGYLADASRKRRESGIINSDVSFSTMSRPDVRREDFTGQSGQVKGVTNLIDSKGQYPYDPVTHSTSKPESLDIAEIEQVGCFPVYGLSREDGAGGDHPLSQPMPSQDRDALQIADLVSHWQPDPSMSRTKEMEFLYDYYNVRKSTLSDAYDYYGTPGLQLVHKSYDTPGNAAILRRMSTYLNDPQFTQSRTGFEIAAMRALVGDSKRFVPCPAVKNGTLG